MIDAALRAQAERWRTALAQRRWAAANDNDPREPPPALSLRLPRIDWTTVWAFAAAA